MKFWKGPSEAPASTPQTGDPTVERCLDAFASVLRLWGENPIELPERSAEEIRELCEGWARHLLLATAPPGSGPEGEDEGEPSVAASARDWPGLERAFKVLREEEHTHVDVTLSELRGIIWVCVQALGRAGNDDVESDARVRKRLSTVRSVAKDADLETLRREVVSTVELIEGEIESRRERHARQVEELSHRLEQMTTALIQQKAEGELDTLTNVYGRAAMDEHLAEICQLGMVVDPTAVAFLIDVDHFKWVNDRYGHRIGDETLVRVAARLRQVFRRSGDFVARYGGDEFLAVIADGSLEVAERIAERALFSIREIEVPTGEEPVRVSVSIGIAALERGQTPAVWLDHADKGLYASKDAGRDRCSRAPVGAAEDSSD